MTRKPKRSRRGRMLRAVELHRDGLSLREIAKILGCNHQTVANDLAIYRKVSNLPSKTTVSSPPKIDRGIDGVVSLSAERFARRQA